ncbi:MAG TPA: hypothetical protein VMW41_00165 [Candidatus Bathyarchaeia archaeon]|nr:hypothetical protein [Candidatus Bathyarchaeia archaeon]
MIKNKTLNTLKLDKEEEVVEKALENNEFIEESSLKAIKKMFEEAVANYRQLKKSKRITIRVNQEDLLKVKAKAQRNKVPYQTLLNALIHQYSNDKLQIRL